MKSKKLIPIFGIGAMLLCCQFLALFIARSFSELGLAAFEEPSDPTNLITILVAIALITLLFLFIATRKRKGFQKLLQVIIFFAIWLLLYYGLIALLSFFFPLELAWILSILISVLSLIGLWIYPEWYLVDACGVIAASSAVALFGISLSIPFILILLVILAGYDAISVYKTKHMIELAKHSVDLNLPLMLVVPNTLKYSFRSNRFPKSPEQRREGPNAMFTGLGDVIIPSMLPVGVYHWVGSLPLTSIIILGIIIGFGILGSRALKGKAQAGLPFLNGGAILAYLIGSYCLFNGLVGLSL
jgi:presenilin-like A22 family membrane protease